MAECVLQVPAVLRHWMNIVQGLKRVARRGALLLLLLLLLVIVAVPAAVVLLLLLLLGRRQRGRRRRGVLASAGRRSRSPLPGAAGELLPTEGVQEHGVLLQPLVAGSGGQDGGGAGTAAALGRRGRVLLAGPPQVLGGRGGCGGRRRARVVYRVGRSLLPRSQTENGTHFGVFITSLVWSPKFAFPLLPEPKR